MVYYLYKICDGTLPKFILFELQQKANNIELKVCFMVISAHALIYFHSETYFISNNQGTKIL